MTSFGLLRAEAFGEKTVGSVELTADSQVITCQGKLERVYSQPSVWLSHFRQILLKHITLLIARVLCSQRRCPNNNL